MSRIESIVSKIEALKDRQSGDDKVLRRLAIIFFLALLTNVVGCAFGYATAHKMISWIIPLGFFLPIINFSISIFFLEAKSLRERIGIILVNSFALSIGGAIVSLYFN